MCESVENVSIGERERRGERKTMYFAQSLLFIGRSKHKRLTNQQKEREREGERECEEGREEDEGGEMRERESLVHFLFSS